MIELKDTSSYRHSSC